MATQKIGVRLHGDKELAAKLRQLGISTSQVLEAAVTAAAVVIEDAAEGMAPGPNIDHATSKKSQSQVTVQVGPDKEHWYYRFAEFGAAPHAIEGPLAFEGNEGPIVVGSVQHPGMAARPFLRPARDTQEEPAKEAMAKVLKSAVEGV